jgi:fermentation-respiration switch protein FrsA (DUF1100 family)
MSYIGKTAVILGASLALGAPVSAQSSDSWSSHRPLRTLESAMLFHSCRADESWLSPPSSLVAQDVWLHAADGNRIHAWWFPCPNASGALLFCHGNAGNLSHRIPMIQPLMQALGLSVLIFDYPGYGRSEGAPSEASCYAAADVAYDWLIHSAGLAPERLVLFGESLGGAVATDLAARRPHGALVLVKTFSSIPSMARNRLLTWPLSGLVHNQFDSLAKIRHCPSPVFIAHGDCDRCNPLAEAHKLEAAAPEPKQFLLLKGSDHNDPLPPQFYSALAAFLNKALRSVAGP